MEWPTSKTLASPKSLTEHIWFIYGPPGIGKSTLFSKFEGSIFWHTDAGLSYISAYKKPVQSWLEFKELVKSFVAAPPKQFKLVVIDTVDLLFTMCSEYVCKKRGIEHQSDEQWGKGFELMRREFTVPVAQLMSMNSRGVGTAFISHAKEVEIRGRAVRTSKIVPTLASMPRGVIIPMCDVVGYAGFDENSAGQEGERKLFFKPSETLEAKDRTHRLPAECPLEFGALAAAFDGKVVQTKSLIKKIGRR